MRELVYFVATTLDGRIAAPDGDFSAFPTEGDHIEMIMRDFPETIPAVVRDQLGITPRPSRFDTVLMGWNTYAVGFPDGIRDPYPPLRQYVFTRSHGDVAEGIEVVRDDPLGAVRRLKEEPAGRGIWLCGGGSLAGALASEIDRLILKVNPIVLGDGIPLIDGGYEPGQFELVDSTRYASGVLLNEYVRRG
jgi:dihydrofolate reductase